MSKGSAVIRPTSLWLVMILLSVGLIASTVRADDDLSRSLTRLSAAPDPFVPAATGGSAALDLALAKLSGHRRLLVVGAHPDDEDTTLLTLVAQGLGGEAAYLSLSRGDGGQNLIGSQLGVGLGIVRSRELEAARRIDGARQFFTRAYDFGYTRSLDETFERWPRRALLEDAVRVVRRFRPQVMVAVFPGNARAGHGQHQASGVIALEAFRAAGDPAMFPELVDEGLEPWTPEAFYRSVWWDPDAATLSYPVGRLDPRSGRSFVQIALDSRSQHRSQDMGSVQRLGPWTGRVALEAGTDAVRSAQTSDAVDPFVGIDTSLSSIARLIEDEQIRAAAESALTDVERRIRELRLGLPAAMPEAATGPLIGIASRLKSVQESLASAGGSAKSGSASALIEEKLAIANEALAAAAGVVFDATIDSEALAPMVSGTTTVELWNAQAENPQGAAVKVSAIEIVSRDGLAVDRLEEPPENQRSRPGRARPPTTSPDLPAQLASGELASWRYRLTPERDMEPSFPYYLASPKQGDLYRWDGAPAEVKGRAFGPPEARAVVSMTIGGHPLTLEREVVYRVGDQAIGEVRRPLRIVPAVEVVVDPDRIVWSTAQGEARTVKVTVTSHLPDPVEGELIFEPSTAGPSDWPVPAAVAFALPRPDEARTFEVELPRPSDPVDSGSGSEQTGRYQFDVVARSATGTAYSSSMPVLDYSHIVPTPQPTAARFEIAAGDIRLPDLGRIAYVRGASDRVPEQLSALGLPIEVMSGDRLGAVDLALYDAVVIGARAYEVDAGLGRSNGRLLDYLRAGGLVVVQYQQYQFVRGEFAALPLTIGRPHGRITDETAPVRLLDSDHPAFTEPNRLNDRDWTGWVQERGLYFAETWDDAYQPLLAFADPGAEELTGGLLVAEVGSGTYVYTGLAFFRQLPAGVVGAYRLFANLLAL